MGFHFRVHLAFSALYYPPQLIVWPIILSSITVALLIVQHIILSSTMIFLKLTLIKYMYTKSLYINTRVFFDPISLVIIT